MNIYKKNGDIFISNHKFKLDEATEKDLKNAEHIYLLKKSGTSCRFRQVVNSLTQIEDRETLNYIIKKEGSSVDDLINGGKLSYINTSFEEWEEMYKVNPLKKKYKVTVAGLGDVGGTLSIGLRLLGYDVISEIGVFDLDENKIKRWEYELNQINYPNNTSLPKVKPVSFDEVFDCDVFIFCITRQVPDVSIQDVDVRIVQYKSNAEIISMYVDAAKKAKYKGYFFVVSDPVDHLCKRAYFELNKDYIFPADNVKGFGLGVMYARSLYYAQNMNIGYFKDKGRTFGPHGKDLIVADNIEDYNHELSLKLTELTTNANIEVRKTGFKPYIAPALSSGALSILSCLKGEWHYSTVSIENAFLGIKNRITEYGVEIETYKNLDERLFERIKKSYERLVEFDV
ncbi:hypothetical protein [Caloramator sp. ALD01]|uniref:hypothetical protein n=1 Tax=Caloramator sp. ALD01 TaxID=1031288 RepID=UPI0003F4F042|nr:hypothetical protein [Caloramator sp. ALD01]